MHPRPRLLSSTLAALLSVSSCQDQPQKPPPPPPVTPPAAAADASAPAAEIAAPPAEPGLAPAIKPPLPPVRAEQAPPPSQRLSDLREADLLRGKVESYFQGHVGRRIYLQTDKPLYKPGETIWLRLWDLKARSLSGAEVSGGMTVELVSPRGAVVVRRRLREQQGAAQADFPITAGMAGGEYTVRVRTFDNQKAERPVIISSYEAPRLQLKLELLRKAYGAGDEVTATIAVRRATGEALRNHALTAMVRLDGEDLPKVLLRTDEQGEGLVRFQLPARIDVGDGLLTVLADDGGLTESVAKRVPIIVNHLALSTFPEGGQLVEGLPGRVYFEAKSPLGKPADVAGRVVDERGQTAASFTSVRDGLGRFDLVPAPGRTYHVEIDRPAGIADRYPLPLPLVSGCVLRSFDDLDGELQALRVAVRCTEPQRVIVGATLRESFLDAAAVEVPGGAPAIAYLAGQGDAAALGRAQGVVRVTVFDEKLNPLAERLVYRNRRARLNVKVEPQRPGYSPREQVVLAVSTTDPAGQPVPAELALSVVDDTVLTYADDKTGHMLSRLYLEPELPGKIEEPNFFFDLAEEKSGPGLDLLMGTRGWRKFEWQQVLRTAPSRTRTEIVATALPRDDFGGLRKNQGEAPNVPKALAAAPKEAQKEGMKDEAPRDVALAVPENAKRPVARGPMPDPSRPAAAPAAPPAVVPQQMALAKVATRAKPAEEPRTAATEEQREAPRREAAAQPERAEKKAKRDEAAGMGGLGMLQGRGAAEGERAPAAAGGAAIAADKPGKGAPMRARRAGGDDLDAFNGFLEDGQVAVRRPMAVARPRPRPAEWAPVRVFPQPVYSAEYSGPRTDFRETLLFQPGLRTDKDGKAEVHFYLSDAISAFRVVTEGVAAGAAGRSEAVIKSSLPFSMAVKVPLEVSEGDHLELPLQLANERQRPLAVDLTAEFGALLKLDRPVARTQGTLAAGAREALFYPLTVIGKRGRSKIHFTASASGLRDEFEREVLVSPRGFPQHIAKSGQVATRFSTELDLGVMLAGTADGKLRLYPSPVASMVSGLEGLLQEPGGCFEQASSTNYPNVMIMRYLRQQRHMDAQLMGRTGQLLDIGYKRLSGYETPRKGYEWFGAAPAHEALTAYGLLQFTDMKEVYPEVDRQMLDRTAAWLRSRRDGKGGYQRDGKALDTFGRASKEVTDAYITYSLTEARQAGLEQELDASERVARETGDAYVLALATGSLLNAGRREAGQAGATRLLQMQDAGGGFLKAGHSITRSGGESLLIETTALSVLSLLKAGGQDEAVRRAVEWLVSHRGGYGQWGATQSTVLALKALTAYAIASRRTEAPGDVTLQVNGQVVGREHYEAGRRAPIVFAELDRFLKPGKNQVEVVHEGKTPLPFTLGVDYRSLKPASSAQAVVELETALEKTELGMGQSVRMNIVARNKTAAGQPMTLLRIGLPGGLTFQTWQLKELRDKGLIAFYETGPREVNLYLREMKPREEVRVPLELLATTPGRFSAPASRAYLYYTSEHKTWVDGVQVTITP